jgi:hypothetical protein
VEHRHDGDQAIVMVRGHAGHPTRRVQQRSRFGVRGTVERSSCLEVDENGNDCSSPGTV